MRKNLIDADENEILLGCAVKNLKVALLIVLALCGFGCKERVPAANTPAFNELHGIVNDGKTVNEIVLINDQNQNHPKLRFSPGVFVNVNTPGARDESNPVSIRRGFAYSTDVWVDLTDALRLKPEPQGRASNSVNVTFHASLGREESQKIETRLREIERLSIRTTEKMEWRLREYVLVTPGTKNISTYEYVPFDENFRSVDGVRMWIGCRAAGSEEDLSSFSSDRTLYGCASHFNYKSGLSLTYRFDPRLLPYWHQIYQEVIRFTDSVLVG